MLYHHTSSFFHCPSPSWFPFHPPESQTGSEHTLSLVGAEEGRMDSPLISMQASCPVVVHPGAGFDREGNTFKTKERVGRREEIVQLDEFVCFPCNRRCTLAPGYVVRRCNCIAPGVSSHHRAARTLCEPRPLQAHVLLSHQRIQIPWQGPPTPHAVRGADPNETPWPGS